MKCLCCGKPIREEASAYEKKQEWHRACVKKFFGTTALPDVDVTEDVLRALADESIHRGFTVPGVQKKISLHLTADENPRLTLVNYPTGYILKPQTSEYPALPEAEYLVMQMAKTAGIRVVPFALIRISAQNGSLAYITRRIDRTLPKKSGEVPRMSAMEDFCQLDGRLTQDKYLGSYERCAKLIAKYSVQAGIDLSELFFRVVFSFAVGNSDMHLKNFSLMETAPQSGYYRLSEAYDMLCVNVVSADKDQFALTMNGKKRNVRGKDFLVFADTVGVPRAAALNMMKRIVSLENTFLAMCRDSFLPKDLKVEFAVLLRERMAILRPPAENAASD